MTRNGIRGPRRRALLIVPTLLAAGAASLVLALGLFGGGGQALADAHATHRAHAHASHAALVPAREVALNQAMRSLWEQHITWTRMVIVDFAAGSPSLPASETRLLRNQTDIGNAVAHYYGRAAGKRLTALLRSHILIAVDVLTAAKAGDSAALARAQARWNRNADQIAAFLASANPAWPRAEMRSMMRLHLKLTTDEAVARLTGDWSADVRAFDEVHVQILRMADMLTDGIVAQFPARFR
jgi:hypothetical protein